MGLPYIWIGVEMGYPMDHQIGDIFGPRKMKPSNLEGTTDFEACPFHHPWSSHIYPRIITIKNGNGKFHIYRLSFHINLHLQQICKPFAGQRVDSELHGFSVATPWHQDFLAFLHLVEVLLHSFLSIKRGIYWRAMLDRKLQEAQLLPRPTGIEPTWTDADLISRFVPGISRGMVIHW